MEIQHAKVVIALVQEGTMIGAAEHLGITQPAVSFSLSQFEKELALLLFHRSRKGLEITQKGKEILPVIRKLLEVQNEILSFSMTQSATQGSLRVAGRQGFMEDVFPILIEKLFTAYPDIKIETALSGNQNDVIESLQSGRADIAFAPSPKVKSITAEVFHRDPIILAVSRKHRLAKKVAISREDLAGLQFCLPTKSDRLRNPIERFLRQLVKHPNIFIETNDYTVMRNIISGGICAGFIYGHMLVNPEANNNLIPLKVKQLEIWRDLTVLYRRDDLSAHGKTAKDFFVTEAKKIFVKYAK